MEKNEFKVRDLRRKEKFFIDDDYINGYARHLDPFATAVYLSLCRHADKYQKCFPSQDRIAKQHKMGRATVARKIALLESHNIIKKEQIRSPQGKFLHNTYLLLDKTCWKLYRVSEKHTDRVSEKNIPCIREVHHRVSERDTKDTHIKDTHIKERERPSKNLLTKKNKYNSIEYLQTLKENELELENLVQQFTCTRRQIINKAADFVDYCISKGKIYKNYKSALSGALSKDFGRRSKKEKTSKSTERYDKFGNLIGGVTQ